MHQRIEGAWNYCTYNPEPGKEGNWLLEGTLYDVTDCYYQTNYFFGVLPPSAFRLPMERTAVKAV